MKAFINIVKVKYSFPDGNEVQGLELNLAPKVKKFIPINKDNADLLRIMGNALIDWYNRVDFGDDLILRQDIEFDKTYSPNSDDNVQHIDVL